MCEVPAFDALCGSEGPYEGFGAILETEDPTAFDAVVTEAQGRVQDVFTIRVEPGRAGVVQLDALVGEMWRTGWEPEAHDLNLFVRDLGGLLMHAVRDELGGQLIFRSATDLSHASVWWSLERVESFPFHKMLKSLCHKDGESLVYYLDGVSRLLGRGK